MGTIAIGSAHSQLSLAGTRPQSHLAMRTPAWTFLITVSGIATQAGGSCLLFNRGPSPLLHLRSGLSSTRVNNGGDAAHQPSQSPDTLPVATLPPLGNLASPQSVAWGGSHGPFLELTVPLSSVLLGLLLSDRAWVSRTQKEETIPFSASCSPSCSAGQRRKKR